MCADFISIKFQVEAEAKLLVSSNSQSAGRVSQCICAYGCGEDALLKFKLGHQNYTNCQFNNFLQNEMKCGKFNWIETLKKKKNRWWEQKVALNIIYVAQYIHIHVNTMAVVPTLYVNLPESGALSLVLKLTNSLTSLTSCCDYNKFKCQCEVLIPLSLSMCY